jgi:hypothetical protein
MGPNTLRFLFEREASQRRPKGLRLEFGHFEGLTGMA